MQVFSNKIYLISTFSLLSCIYKIYVFSMISLSSFFLSNGMKMELFMGCFAFLLYNTCSFPISLQNNNEGAPNAKKRKSSVGYTLPKEVEKLIAQDIKNSKLWNECKTNILDGRTVGYSISFPLFLYHYNVFAPILLLW